MGYIMITGGSLVNKGAQAMTYVTVCEMKKRFPDKKILVVMDMSGIPEGTALANYDFEIVDTHVLGREALFWLGGSWSVTALKRGVSKKKLLKVRSIWKNTDYVMDISGYAIGKKWGLLRSCRTAMKAALAKKYHAHCIFLPQSFGPFDFQSEGEEQQKAREILKKWLSCADVLYAREESGKQMLQELGLTNVKLAQDIVLQNKDYDIHMIYKQTPCMQEIHTEEKSVALIPNKHVTSVKVNDVYHLWDVAIHTLLAKGYYVYLMMHDNSDLQIIREIKARHADEDRVILVENDFSCIEYNELIKKFQFIVASRYHSIVHAYRNSVPAVVLGWADKYETLLSAVDQQAYDLDLRREVEDTRLVECLENMHVKREQNVTAIKSRLQEIQRNNVFDELFAREG